MKALNIIAKGIGSIVKLILGLIWGLFKLTLLLFGLIGRIFLSLVRIAARP